MRRVLVIAYHFPPCQGSSGMQRTLRFCQHLPEFGWRPIVLTISPWAYEKRSALAGNEIPPGLEVHRAFGLDAARHLSLFGRYPGFLALPDRWGSWRLPAVASALGIVRRQPVDAVWSTFPIATAHRIALDVGTRARLPWVADFRDPMWQGDYPPDPLANRAWQRLEQEIFAAASRVVVTTPGAARLYAERFPQFPGAHLAVIENGYDESSFARAGDVVPAPAAGVPRPLVLLHSGVVYPSERDPTRFFAALASLKRRGSVSASDLQVVLRASGEEGRYRSVVQAAGIDDIVRFEPPVDYLSALREMLGVDGLLVLQASNCNAQVPAKLYEYLRAGRPILALTDPAGDTARTLEAAGTGLICRLDDQAAIENALLRFIGDIRDGNWRRPTAQTVAAFSRERQAERLARLLDEVAGATAGQRRR
jgi:glycosyltransferase involved in cell wall biosynthesis